MSAGVTYKIIDNSNNCDVWAIFFDGIRIDTAYFTADGWWLEFGDESFFTLRRAINDIMGMLRP